MQLLSTIWTHFRDISTQLNWKNTLKHKLPRLYLFLFFFFFNIFKMLWHFLADIISSYY